MYGIGTGLNAAIQGYDRGVDRTRETQQYQQRQQDRQEFGLPAASLRLDEEQMRAQQQHRANQTAADNQEMSHSYFAAKAGDYEPMKRLAARLMPDDPIDIVPGDDGTLTINHLKNGQSAS